MATAEAFDPFNPGVMVGLERVAAKPGSSNSIRVNLVCLILVF
jgi:hypothetical protein